MESSGERLKKIRLEKGLTLEEAHKKTKIHVNILKAMEGDSLTELSPIYLKGFLKIYCNFLGVDPKDYVPDYKEAPGAAKAVLTPQASADKPKNAPSFIKGAGSKLASFRPDPKLVKTAVYILVFALVALGVFSLGKKLFSKRAGVTKTAQSAKSAKPRKQEPAAKENAAQVNTAKGKDNSGLIRLGIRTTRDKCLISVKADGKPVFHNVLAKGRFENWQAKDRFELAVSDASAVELEVNGKFFSNLGTRKQKLNILINNEKGLVIKR